MTIPFMIVVVFCVVIGANSRCGRLAFLGSQRCGHHCHWDRKRGAQQGRIEETGHHYFHVCKLEQVWGQRGEPDE